MSKHQERRARPYGKDVVPHVYDAFTVKYLETEGTQRGFKSSTDEEEDVRRSGASRASLTELGGGALMHGWGRVH